MKENQKWFTPILNFAVHSIIGTLTFMLVALPAVALDLFVQYLTTLGASAFTITVLSLLEGAIVVLDALATLWYIVLKAYREFKDM